MKELYGIDMEKTQYSKKIIDSIEHMILQLKNKLM